MEYKDVGVGCKICILFGLRWNGEEMEWRRL